MNIGGPMGFKYRTQTTLKSKTAVTFIARSYMKVIDEESIAV